MVRSLRRPPAALWLATGAVLLVACGGSGEASEPSPSPTVTASPSPSPTPAPSPSPIAIDVAAVPDEIDVAYAQAVMDALDAELGELAEELAANGDGFDEATTAHLASLYTPALAGNARSLWERFVLPNLPDDPQPPVTTVRTVRSQEEDCFAIDATRDLTPLGVPDDALPGDDWTLVLKRKEGAPDVSNPTPWVVQLEVTEVQEGDPCGV